MIGQRGGDTVRISRLEDESDVESGGGGFVTITHVEHQSAESSSSAVSLPPFRFPPLWRLLTLPNRPFDEAAC